MKRLLFLLSLSILSAFAYSDEEHPNPGHHVTQGKIWALKDRDIIPLKAHLLLPPRGEGSIFLKIKNKKHKINTKVESLDFFVERKNGRSIFYIIFPYNENDVAVLKGSYMRDSKLALYSGDVFIGSKEASQNLNSQKSLLHRDFEFKGTFTFKTKIEQN